MKYLVFIPLVFVASCASHPKPRISVKPARSSAVEPVEAVRYGDVVRAYHVGRFIDPNHPETMHEGHPIYRIEASARWDLHPGSRNDPNLLNPPPDAAFSPPPTNDVIIAEMARQREATDRVMREAAGLAQAFGELQSSLDEMRNVARNDALLTVRLAHAEQRLAEFEKEMRMLTAPASPMTTDAPAFAPELPDAPKP